MWFSSSRKPPHAHADLPSYLRIPSIRFLLPSLPTLYPLPPSAFLLTLLSPLRLLPPSSTYIILPPPYPTSLPPSLIFAIPAPSPLPTPSPSTSPLLPPPRRLQANRQGINHSYSETRRNSPQFRSGKTFLVRSISAGCRGAVRTDSSRTVSTALALVVPRSAEENSDCFMAAEGFLRDGRLTPRGISRGKRALERSSKAKREPPKRRIKQMLSPKLSSGSRRFPGGGGRPQLPCLLVVSFTS